MYTNFKISSPSSPDSLCSQCVDRPSANHDSGYHNVKDSPTNIHFALLYITHNRYIVTLQTVHKC